MITPTWNRASHLSKVWTGLQKQTFRDFEWIVGNDGSKDHTDQVVRELAALSDFPITLVTATERVGKSRIDNEAVSRSRGQFVVWCDSDDILLPNALEMLLFTWEEVPESDRHAFCGVSALCDTEDGVLGKKFYCSDQPFNIVWNELYHKLGSDLVIFTRADLVKKHPFLEVDFLIPETSVWNAIGVRQTRFLPKVLERKSYREVNALSYSGHMSYNRGYAYALTQTKQYAINYLSVFSRLKRAINYLRYCRHGEIPFKLALNLWDANRLEALMFVFLFPVSSLLAFKDRAEGKVKRTHRDFIASQITATFQSEELIIGKSPR